MTELTEKSFDFAIRIIELNRYLSEEGKKFVLADRLLSCGTGIGFQIRQLEGKGKKEKDGILGEALRCVEESGYLLDLMVETGNLGEAQSEIIRGDCDKLKKMIMDEKQK